MSFVGKNVIVTGAAGALGSATFKYFSSAGARTIAIDYSDELLDRTFPERSNDERNLYVVADLTKRQSCADALEIIRERVSGVDILANIAGGFLMGEAVHETSDETWDFLFELNTRSILNMAAAVVPIMLQNGSGKIINIAARAATKGAGKMGAYTASKAAVMRLTESMALELRQDNINVNCILPGTIDTPRNREDMPKAKFDTWVDPTDIAQVIGFLASDEASAVHGAGIPVDGLS